jgi:hypothetical protein
MFGPDYTAGCPSCSALAGGFKGVDVHKSLPAWAKITSMSIDKDYKLSKLEDLLASDRQAQISSNLVVLHSATTTRRYF